MADWSEQIIEVERRKQEFLLGWQEEIEAVRAYAQIPIGPWQQCTITPENVIPRLGPELTATARAVYRLHRQAATALDNLHGHPDHPELHRHAALTAGARHAIMVGLGVHLSLDQQHSIWLVEGLSGYADNDLEQLINWTNLHNRMTPEL
ncbi:MAG TPA: hypothetical protein VG247_34740 [Pseudonocardiaceae bacterium]|jgi:hypothetical protein|nr:hypothetical protein [Pseudonocardiaceae bacterium]